MRSFARFFRRLLADRRGAALAEYGILVAGITLAGLVAVSMLGEKVGGLVSSLATVLPGAQAEQNAEITVGSLIETKTGDSNQNGILDITMDVTKMTHSEFNAGKERLGMAYGLNPHDSSHLMQRGSLDTRFHRGSGGGTAP